MFAGHCTPSGYIDTHVFMTYRDHYGITLELLDQWIKLSTDTRSFFAYLCTHAIKRFNASYFIEKSPSNIYSFSRLSSDFPEVPLIHLIRDGRDVVTSLMKRDFNLFGAGSRWLYDTVAGLRSRGAKRYLEVRYEDFVSNPSQSLRAIFDHLELPFDSNILSIGHDHRAGVYTENWRERKEPRVWKQTPGDPISTASIGRYRRELTKNDLSVLYRIKLTKHAAATFQCQPYSFRELLEILGYDIREDVSDWNTITIPRFKEIKFELDDYYRRVRRFVNAGYFAAPSRLTYILNRSKDKVTGKT
jgi:hypothetical protein